VIRNCESRKAFLKNQREKAELLGEMVFFKDSALNLKRNERALRVIRMLRGREQRQHKKIDILCRDIVGAHGEFIQKIATLSFVLRFQESLLGISELTSILDTAAGFIRENLDAAGVAIFLVEPKGFDIHFSNSTSEFAVEKGNFETWFTSQVVQEISRSSRICTLEQMLQMGLQANPAMLKHITVAAVPLGKMGKGVGFILLYRQAEKPFTGEEFGNICAAAPGLRIAIQKHHAIAENSVQS
jgi:hypothetical protein